MSCEQLPWFRTDDDHDTCGTAPACAVALEALCAPGDACEDGFVFVEGKKREDMDWTRLTRQVPLACTGEIESLSLPMIRAVDPCEEWTVRPVFVCGGEPCRPPDDVSGRARVFLRCEEPATDG